MRWHDTHGDDRTVLRALGACSNSLVKRFGIRNNMICGHDYEDSVLAVRHRVHGSDSQRGRRIARKRLKDETGTLATGSQLVGSRKAMIFSAHDDCVVNTRSAVGQAIQTPCGGLQQ